jgi:integrase
MKQIVLFNKNVLDKLQPQTKRYFVADPKTPFLKLAIYESGIKTFILYRKVNGTPQRIKIGNYDLLTIEQARKKAKDLNAQIELGGNPHKERLKNKRALTFEELYNIYYNEYALIFTKRPNENKKTMANHVFPIFGRTKITDISSQQIQSFYTKLGDRISKYSNDSNIKKSHGSANRVITIVKAVFNFGIKGGYLEGTNPCQGLRRYQANSRDRFLTSTELQSFFKALTKETQLFSDLFKILLFTGARKSNVLSMKFSDLSFDLKRWRIPESQTKNSDVNVVPLSDQSIKILMVREAFNEFRKCPSAYLFPGDGKDGHLKDPKKSFSRIKRRMKVDDIRIHDLRRTLGSFMAINGASLPIIGKALNHKSHVSTAIYARLSHDPVLNAVNNATHSMQLYKSSVAKNTF